MEQLATKSLLWFSSLDRQTGRSGNFRLFCPSPLSSFLPLLTPFLLPPSILISHRFCLLSFSHQTSFISSTSSPSLTKPASSLLSVSLPLLLCHFLILPNQLSLFIISPSHVSSLSLSLPEVAKTINRLQSSLPFCSLHSFIPLFPSLHLSLREVAPGPGRLSSSRPVWL